MLTTVSVTDLIGVLRQNMKAFVGTPDELVTHIQAYVAAGADEIVVQWGDMDDIEGLELPAREVLP